jgi:uncharacterized protein YjiS (DUF1127 family)
MTQLVSTFVTLFDFTWIKTRVKNYFDYLDRNREIKETIKELSRLSDAELRDIGITRGDIYSVAHEVYYDDLAKVNRNLKGWV